MPADILVSANDKPSGVLKGAPIDVRDVSELVTRPWGDSEFLPGFVHAIISDATADQVRHYLNQWENEITYDLIASNAEGRRYTLSINPNIVTVFGAEFGITTEYDIYLLETYGAILFDRDINNTWATYDIPNTDWQALRDDVLDKFLQSVSPNRYLFKDTAVDLAISQGGTITITAAQAINNITDRLA